MKRGTLIALLLGAVFGVWGAAKAHDHAPPVTCVDWCDDTECKCWERCVQRDAGLPSECTKGCAMDREACDLSCEGGGS